MAQLVQYDASENRQHRGDAPQQAVPLRIGPASQTRYGQQGEEGEVHLELNAPDAEKVH